MPTDYAVKNRLDRADEISLLQARLAKAKQAGRKEQEIDLLLAISERASASGDFGLANFHLQIAAKVIRQSRKHLEKLHEVLGESALLMRKAKRLEESLALYQEAEEAAKQHNGIADAALWKGKQGNVYRLQEKLDVARTCYEEALKAFESLGHAGYEGAAEQEGCLGLVEQALGNSDGTLDHYRRAVEFAAKSGAPEVICTWNKNYGNELCAAVGQLMSRYVLDDLNVFSPETTICEIATERLIESTIAIVPKAAKAEKYETSLICPRCGAEL